MKIANRNDVWYDGGISWMLPDIVPARLVQRLSAHGSFGTL
jgi:hypothetical protein